MVTPVHTIMVCPRQAYHVIQELTIQVVGMVVSKQVPVSLLYCLTFFLIGYYVSGYGWSSQSACGGG